jgi:hypothetical protein
MTGPQALLVSSGDGPGECRQAVAHVLARLAGEAARLCLDLDVAERSAEHGPSSAVVLLNGAEAEAMARDWEGVILWRCRSAAPAPCAQDPVRAGLSPGARCSRRADRPRGGDDAGDPRRRSGGQRQNTTSSAAHRAGSSRGRSSGRHDPVAWLRRASNGARSGKGYRAVGSAMGAKADRIFRFYELFRDIA